MNKFKIIALITVGISLFLYFQNNYIVTDHITVSSDRLPPSFNGYTIVQISDLHGKIFGGDNKTLISKIRKAKPDLIVITGDLLNYQSYNEKIISGFISEVTKIAVTYYVTGNHEINSWYLTTLIHSLENQGVKVLRNTSDIIEKNGEFISIIGINDPRETDKDIINLNTKTVSSELNIALENDQVSDYTILLYHRPEDFKLYAAYGIDLIFSGHAHGGQIRLPLIGGLYAPNQGFFPKYTSGKYVEGNSTMIVSRGLGNSTIRQRIFNNPEIVVVTLFSKKSSYIFRLSNI